MEEVSEESGQVRLSYPGGNHHAMGRAMFPTFSEENSLPLAIDPRHADLSPENVKAMHGFALLPGKLPNDVALLLRIRMLADAGNHKQLRLKHDPTAASAC